MNTKTILVLATAMAASCASSGAAPDFVPVENEPHHRTVLVNDYLQVFHVTLEPGESSLMHRHVHDDAAVRLSTATIAMDSPGQSMGAGEVMVPGGVSARPCSTQPVTHRVHNVGTTQFQIMDVQILKRPDGPASPPVVAPAAENPQMRVYHYDLPAGSTSAPHTHSRPYLLVAATDVNLRVTTADGRSAAMPLKAGEFRWIEAAATHTFANDGGANGIVVEFELK